MMPMIQRLPLVPALLVAAALFSLLPGCSDDPHYETQVIILGFDGMDAKLTEQLMSDGRLPTLEKIRQAGGYRPLGTSTPPQSPVAWCTFQTGTNPGEHGIFDFIHRDPKTYAPYASTAESTDGAWALELGQYVMYLKGGEVLNLRRGTPFWEYLTEASVPAQIFRLPANYPPTPSEGAYFRTLTDMGTPDIRGSQGEFSFYTSGPFNFRKRISGGGAYYIRFKDNEGQASFYGPPDPMIKLDDPNEQAPPTEVPFTVYRDPEDSAVRISWADQDVLVQEGEWTDWYPVEFEMGPRAAIGSWDIGPLVPGSSAKSICRFYLKQVRPYFELYVTPFNVDPLSPSLPVSEPADFATEVAGEVGRYYTQGLCEDTKALTYKILTRDEFLQQAEIVHQERLKLFDYALDAYQGGLMYFYFGGTDQIAHMFWGARHPDHPALTEEEHQKYQYVVEGIYERMDGVVAQAMKRFPDATVLLLSDHGFETFTRQFNVNTWLVENGYASMLYPSQRSMPMNFNWAKTRAYALGINGLYINLVGREADGIVPPEEKQALMDEIAGKMLEYRDPQSGARVIKEMYQADRVYSGEQIKIGPDMQIGYDRTFRGSWSTALGEIPKNIMADNTNAWCADHCIATDLVPGVLFANRPLRLEDPDLEDIAPTVLNQFGVPVPEQMKGRDVFAAQSLAELAK